MTYNDRANLIQELAKESGLTGRPKLEANHYDRTTGTLFIGSKVYHYDDINYPRPCGSQTVLWTGSVRT